MKLYKHHQMISHNITKICVFALMITTFSLKIWAQQKFLINNQSNPLKKFSVSSHKESHPFFVDINSDGKPDCFSGEYTNGQLSRIYYYRNDGSSKNPVFRQMTGVDNPLDKAVANVTTIPCFIDIDTDNDYDCFIGEGTKGAIMYYKNTGSSTNPKFEKQSAAYNPLSMVKFSASGIANPAFADLDGDGDYDCLVTDEEGNEHYFRNTGTAKNPVFVHVLNTEDPFKSITEEKGFYNVSFKDWNNDGLIDLFINTTWYKNIGTKNQPQFAISNDNKPIFQDKSLDQFAYTPLRWVDVNNDGNTEVFKGTFNGSFIYQTLSSENSNAINPNLVTVIHVFPNPAKEEFMLTIPATASTETMIHVTDLQGKILSTRIINTGSLKFGKELKPGVYFIQVIQNNTVIYAQKLIKG